MAVAILATGVAAKYVRSQKDMAPADVLARDGGKGDWDKQGAKEMAKKGQGNEVGQAMGQAPLPSLELAHTKAHSFPQLTFSFA